MRCLGRLGTPGSPAGAPRQRRPSMRAGGRAEWPSRPLRECRPARRRGLRSLDPQLPASAACPRLHRRLAAATSTATAAAGSRRGGGRPRARPRRDSRAPPLLSYQSGPRQAGGEAGRQHTLGDGRVRRRARDLNNEKRPGERPACPRTSARAICALGAPAAGPRPSAPAPFGPPPPRLPPAPRAAPPRSGAPEPPRPHNWVHAATAAAQVALAASALFGGAMGLGVAAMELSRGAPRRAAPG
jgi:hypothetical protein